MVRFYSFCYILFLVADSTVLADVRVWTDRGGSFQVEATLLDFDGKNVKLKKNEDGKVITLPIDKLSLPDQAYVRKTMETVSGETTVSTPRKPETDDPEELPLSDGSFRGRIPRTRLSAAPVIRTDLSKPSWSIKPDSSKTVTFSPRTVTIPCGGKDSRARIEEHTFAFADEAPEKMLFTVEVEIGRKHMTMAWLADVKTGAIRNRVAWPVKLRSWGLSPDGSKALFTQLDETSNIDRFKHLTIADTTQPKMPCVGVLVPFAEKSTDRGSDRDAMVKRAAWVDDDHVLALSEGGLLTLLRIRDGSAVWMLESGSGNPFQLSHGKKYLVAYSTKSKCYCLLETMTGRPIGRLEAPTENGRMNGYCSGFDFSPDGTLLAASSGGDLYLWDILTGAHMEPVHCGSGFFRSVHWLDGNHVLVGSTLVHAWEQIPIWKYEGTDPRDFVFNNWYWHVENDRRNNTFRVSPIKLPHDGIPELPEMDDVEKFSVRPGMSIAINIDPSIPENEKIKSLWTKKLLDLGFRVGNRAEITLHARIKTEPPETVYYHGIGGPGPSRSHVDFRPHTYSCAFEQGEKVLWSKSERTQAPHIIHSEMKDRTFQQYMDERSKPTPAWYFNVYFPQRIPFDKAGKSAIMPIGNRR